MVCMYVYSDAKEAESRAGRGERCRPRIGLRGDSVCMAPGMATASEAATPTTAHTQAGVLLLPLRLLPVLLLPLPLLPLLLPLLSMLPGGSSHVMLMVARDKLYVPAAGVQPAALCPSVDRQTPPAAPHTPSAAAPHTSTAAVRPAHPPPWFRRPALGATPRGGGTQRWSRRRQCLLPLYRTGFATGPPRLPRWRGCTPGKGRPGCCCAAPPSAQRRGGARLLGEGFARRKHRGHEAQASPAAARRHSRKNLGPPTLRARSAGRRGRWWRHACLQMMPACVAAAICMGPS